MTETAQNPELPEETHEFNSFFDLLTSQGADRVYFGEESPETIRQWINNPMTSHRQIKRLSRRMYSRNGVYTNVIDYMKSLPTLDRVAYATKNEKKNVPKNIEKANTFADQIRDKSFVRDVLMGGLIDGEQYAYAWIEKTAPLPKSLGDLDIDNIKE
ncbi:hypothetical protein EVJ32_04505, partial [Exiguobacterium sp. SH5S4]|uniref:hypothetical protein n=1 Tax=Exiguobacterium sp. SH5S4 TaxID=2510961 RepID=UPI0010F218C9